MMRAARRRAAAMTPPRPTAPSPTTATTLPGVTPALTAAWWPVLMTSESVSTPAIVASEWPEPGTTTRVASAKGTRTASPWPPSNPSVPNAPPATQLDVQPARQFAQVPSLYLNGATTRSPTGMAYTSAPTCSTTPTNSWPIGPGAWGDSP